jgi:predicted amidophosphoribosyltransferase
MSWNKCPGCLITTRASAYCPNCGEPLTIVCPQCGLTWRFWEGHKYCPRCGTEANRSGVGRISKE